MKWLYIFWGGFVLIGGLGVSLYFGAQPKTVPMFKLSFFSEPEKIGEEVAKVTEETIAKSPVLFLGVDPYSEADMHIWKGFLNKLSVQGLKYEVIVVDPHLQFKAIISATEEMDLKEERSRFAEGIKSASAKNIRMAIIVPTIYSSQLIKQNPLDLLKQDLQINPVSMSLVPFNFNEADEVEKQYPCIVERDVEGIGPIGCAIQVKERSLRLRKEKAHGWAGMMDLVGDNDYLVFNQKVRPTN